MLQSVCLAWSPQKKLSCGCRFSVSNFIKTKELFIFYLRSCVFFIELLCFFPSVIAMISFTSAFCSCPVAAPKAAAQVIQSSAAPTDTHTHTQTAVMEWPLMSSTLSHSWNTDIISALDDRPPFRMREFEAALVHCSYFVVAHFQSRFMWAQLSRLLFIIYVCFPLNQDNVLPCSASSLTVLSGLGDDKRPPPM